MGQGSIHVTTEAQDGGDSVTREEWDALSSDEQFEWMQLMCKSDRELRSILQMIPCPDHGECIPYAKDWIARHKMTNEEVEALNLLGQAMTAFDKLPPLHGADRPEFIHAIHACQNIVLARAGLRATGITDRLDNPYAQGQ